MQFCQRKALKCLPWGLFGMRAMCRQAARLTIFAHKKLKGNKTCIFNSISQNGPSLYVRKLHFPENIRLNFRAEFPTFEIFVLKLVNWTFVSLRTLSSVFWHFEWIYAALFQMTLADSMNPNALVTTSFFPVLEYLRTRKSKADGMNTLHWNLSPDTMVENSLKSLTSTFLTLKIFFLFSNSIWIRTQWDLFATFKHCAWIDGSDANGINLLRKVQFLL